MRSSQTQSNRAMKWAWGIGLGTLLSACGGGSSDPVVPDEPPTGTATGILSDAPVEGVKFTTSSGITGTTDAAGAFTYKAGDSVSFELGAITLGAVTASALVTPLDLAAGNDDKLANLLVLLQSLDDDGNAANGVKIPAAAAAAVTAGIDLAQTAAAFASSANTALASAMTAGGITRAITSTADAQAHFVEQSKALFSSQVWVGGTGAGGSVTVQRFGPNGEYLIGEFGAAEGEGLPGLEYGTAVASLVDARGFKLVPTIEIDSNGTRGLSHPSACERARVSGSQLSYQAAPESCVTTTSVSLSPAENDAKGIVGVWNLGAAEFVKSQTFVFWADGRYAMLDPYGDTEVNSCGGPGVEYGTYSYNASTQEFKVTSVSVDTNGCAGINDTTAGAAGMASFKLTLSSDGLTALAVFGDSTDTIFRVSR